MWGVASVLLTGKVFFLVTPRTRTALIVSAPLVAVATLAVGMRVGAGTAFRAALVHGAAPGSLVAGKRPYAFQVTTYYEDRGVREVIAMKGLSVVARTEDGQESTWSGESNVDGIAEVGLSFANDPKRIAFVLSVTGEREPLAAGIVDITRAPRIAHAPAADARPLRPSKREGALGIDVFIDGDRLVVGSPTTMFVHVTRDGKPVATGGATLHASPEIGVRFEREDAKTGCENIAALHAVALGQAASTLIEATTPDGAKGTWFGTLPTAPGAFALDFPRVFPSSTRATVLIVAPNARENVYVEIDGEEGRDYAAVLPLAVDRASGDPLPRARFELPLLSPGQHWLVASGDPRGAEHLGGVTIAKSFLVTPTQPEWTASGEPPGPFPPGDGPCNAVDTGARRGFVGVPRALVLDGIATRGAQNRATRRRGMFIGLAALAAATLLELLLLTAAAREAKLVLEQADNESPERVTAKPPGGGVVVALLVAVLGFAFLAALIIAKA